MVKYMPEARQLYDDAGGIMIPVDSATVVEIGDLLWLDTDNAKPASDVSDQGTEAANQEWFHDRFLGVALDRSQDGETEEIRVATCGVWEFDCPSGTYEVGDLLGVDENFAGSALLDQQVAKVATANLAVGRCVRRVPSADSRVRVAIVSSTLWGGPQSLV